MTLNRCTVVYTVRYTVLKSTHKYSKKLPKKYMQHDIVEAQTAGNDTCHDSDDDVGWFVNLSMWKHFVGIYQNSHVLASMQGIVDNGPEAWREHLRTCLSS